MKSYARIETKYFLPEEYQKAKEKAQKQRLILQIDYTKLKNKKGEKKMLKELTKMLLVAKVEIKDLTKQLEEMNAEIRQVEKKYETTIDQQYSELQKLRTQLANRTDLEGKFYVFNPLADKPRKIYDTYAAALEDAKKVSKVCGGQRILVLKIVSGVEINEKFIDFSLEEEVPF